ncbi:lysophospholipid acyltransferase LPEAT1-like isoform X3 [Sorghum bicolor]|uniref:lysophospholipid acyltransferase LPEAT1-like isoform X3 n=1 Tax=Sorghum bicolor TaxID=4558 RepID=UPI000B424D6C|nr:lysophospholipid acyltransferase LPEAT1-like isoform X3 [Sorghum bicolor]|eukprot:XP_021303923.1 lysophospholipid acyltransferase LPEAT1-like isoform X3 [Sorghum bicolor]
MAPNEAANITTPSEPESVGGSEMSSEDTAAARPLLSSSSPSPSLSPSAASAAPVLESIEELDRRYAPYARRDAYGPMGLGPLSAAEAARLAFAAVVLVPLRVMAGVLVLVVYYLVCRVCTLRVEEEREGGEGDGYARLDGWRRAGVVRCGRALARAMLFVFGFYWIREYDCRFPNAEVVTMSSSSSQDDDVDQSKETERPGAIVSNHVSYVDILYHMSASFPSFVAKRSVARLPLVGLISKCLGCIFVQRESKTSDFKGVSGAVTERIQRAHQQKNAPVMLLFPEGTTTNGDYLLPFKTGAFLAKAPLRPVILRYPYKRFNPAWESMSGARHVFLLLCQFVNYLEVVHLPVYYPSEQEKDDSKLYANNVRKLMAVEGNLILSDLGLAEKRVYHAALNGNSLPRALHQKDD